MISVLGIDSGRITGKREVIPRSGLPTIREFASLITTSAFVGTNPTDKPITVSPASFSCPLAPQLARDGKLHAVSLGGTNRIAGPRFLVQ